MCDLLRLGIIGLDDQLRVQVLNESAASLLRRTAAATRGQRLTWLLPELDHDLLQASQHDPAGTETSLIVRHVHHTLAGRVITPKPPIDGISLLVSLLDVSSYQLGEGARTHLLRIIIHDLANPINIALNLARMIEEGVLSAQEASESVGIIVKQLGKMSDLLHDIALADQAMEQDISRSLEPVHLDTICALVVNDLSERAAENQITLRLNPLPPELPPLNGNERLLRQALHNLIENAIKYTLPQGWVRVTLRYRAESTDVLVADNGIGVPPAQQAQLFAPFYRVMDPRLAHVKGTGLGLNLVYMIAHQHGGTVKLYSVPNQGSIFVLRLPNSRVDGQA
ncbi:MAG: HAMP domain-containing histidine kinase [Anaerolineae bacterium]|nr:HAMP domain-containing histidine kinase [Anaerolineae bacterium]